MLFELELEQTQGGFIPAAHETYEMYIFGS
jgi:hypothetical protein